MDLNSPLFDRIRVKPEQRDEPREDRVRCNYPGCEEAGEFRAPMGRLREGQYFCFCLDHVREYNASYNYFNGMSDDAIARYQRDDLVGHRPTWSMGVNRAGRAFREDPADPKSFSDPLGLFRARSHRARPEAKQSRYGLAATKALTTLGLDELGRFRRHQVALQGSGQTAPSGRQWRGSLVRGQIARDHPRL